MTNETEAKTKWCPMVRFHGTPSDDSVPNRPLSLNTFYCVGSACMAWRWSRAKETEAYILAVQEHMKKTGKNFNVASNEVFAEREDTFEHVEGFCGLAGKP